jgi:ribosome-associated protein
MSDQFDDIEQYDEEYKSKTQIKREAEALQKLGAKLLTQKKQVLAKLELSDELRAALKESARIKQNEAKRRHLQYIGKLMRDADVEQIQQAIDRQAAGTQAYAQHFHKLERWRDQLLQDDNHIQAFTTEYPAADRQHLRQMLRNARKEAEQNKPPASARKLFKYIRDLDEND